MLITPLAHARVFSDTRFSNSALMRFTSVRTCVLALKTVPIALLAVAASSILRSSRPKTDVVLVCYLRVRPRLQAVLTYFAGVRAKEDIRKGQFIDKYVGEIITAEEANRRRENAKYRKDLYLFALDKFNDPEAEDERLRGEPFEVDGEFIAGPTRFINHSCEPNLRIMAVVTDRANKHLHELCFFALEDIPRLTELTFDYVAGTNTADSNDNVAKEAKERQAKGEFTQKCLCGSKNCRGSLW
jgi:hypothetical protein